MARVASCPRVTFWSKKQKFQNRFAWSAKRSHTLWESSQPLIGHLGPKSDFSKKWFPVFFLYILFGVLCWGHFFKKKKKMLPSAALRFGWRFSPGGQPLPHPGLRVSVLVMVFPQRATASSPERIYKYI